MSPLHEGILQDAEEEPYDPLHPSYKWPDGSHQPYEGRVGDEERVESRNNKAVVEGSKTNKENRFSPTTKDGAAKAK